MTGTPVAAIRAVGQREIPPRGAVGKLGANVGVGATIRVEKGDTVGATVGKLGNVGAVVGTPVKVAAIMAVGQKDIPPPKVGTVGAKVGTGASIAAGKVPAVTGTVGAMVAIMAVGQNGKPAVGANVPVKLGKMGVGGIIRAVIPGASVGTGAVVKGDTAVVGVKMTAKLLDEIKIKIEIMNNPMHKYLEDLI